MITISKSKVTSVVLAASMLFSAQLGVTSAIASTPATVSSTSTTKVPSSGTQTISINGANTSVDFRLFAYNGAVPWSPTTPDAPKTNVVVNRLSQITAAIGGTITPKPVFNVVVNGKPTVVKVDSTNRTFKIDVAGQTYWITQNSTTARVGAAVNPTQYAALPTVTLPRTPVVISSNLHIQIDSFFTLIGGEWITVGTSREYSSFKLLTDVLDQKYLNANTTLIVKGTETNNEYFTVSNATRAATKLNGITVDTSELLPSPDGTKVAYLDENSKIYVYTFGPNGNGTEVEVSSNITEKLELEWTDNNTLFFIMGERQNIIARVNVSTGTITNIVNDNVNYKSQLNVSSDGTKLSYLVTVPAVTTANTTGLVPDSDNIEFDVTVNTTGTEPQLYVFDSSVASPAPAKLTTSVDNKTFTTAFADGTTVFLSTDTADDESLPTLSIVKGTNLRTLVLANVEIVNYTQLGDKLVVQGTYAEPGSTTSKDFVYEIDTFKNRAKTLFEIPTDAIDFSIGASSSQISYITETGKTFVRKGNSWFQLTN
jgi:hypothetical protein